ncbi:MAG TPA: transcription termination/antitermination NusG family protein [Hanamia sp.]|nr:transcription termination/antitermination NusG family protein [Hanamia sp.]
MKNNWYVVYTKPGCERKVSVLLTKKKMEIYFPLNHERSRSFFLRNRIIEVPLFKSYLFVKTTEVDITTLCKTIKNIVSILFWMSKPAIISDDEIFGIREFIINHREITLEKLKVNLEIPRQTMDVTSYLIDGGVLIVKHNTGKLNLPSLGFTLIANVEEEGFIGTGIKPGIMGPFVQI